MQENATQALFRPHQSIDQLHMQDNSSQEARKDLRSFIVNEEDFHFSDQPDHREWKFRVRHESPKYAFLPYQTQKSLGSVESDIMDDIFDIIDHIDPKTEKEGFKPRYSSINDFFRDPPTCSENQDSIQPDDLRTEGSTFKDKEIQSLNNIVEKLGWKYSVKALIVLLESSIKKGPSTFVNSLEEIDILITSIDEWCSVHQKSFDSLSFHMYPLFNFFDRILGVEHSSIVIPSLKWLTKLVEVSKSLNMIILLLNNIIQVRYRYPAALFELHSSVFPELYMIFDSGHHEQDTCSMLESSISCFESINSHDDPGLICTVCTFIVTKEILRSLRNEKKSSGIFFETELNVDSLLILVQMCDMARDEFQTCEERRVNSSPRKDLFSYLTLYNTLAIFQIQFRKSDTSRPSIAFLSQSNLGREFSSLSDSITGLLLDLYTRTFMVTLDSEYLPVLVQFGIISSEVPDEENFRLCQLSESILISSFNALNPSCLLQLKAVNNFLTLSNSQDLLPLLSQIFYKSAQGSHFQHAFRNEASASEEVQIFQSLLFTYMQGMNSTLSHHFDSDKRSDMTSLSFLLENLQRPEYIIISTVLSCFFKTTLRQMEAQDVSYVPIEQINSILNGLLYGAVKKLKFISSLSPCALLSTLLSDRHFQSWSFIYFFVFPALSFISRLSSFQTNDSLQISYKLYPSLLEMLQITGTLRERKYVLSCSWINSLYSQVFYLAAELASGVLISLPVSASEHTFDTFGFSKLSSDGLELYKLSKYTLLNTWYSHLTPQVENKDTDNNLVEFLDNILTKKGNGKVLVEYLEKHSSRKMKLPPRIIPFARKATRHVFGVLLKHSSRTQQAFLFSARILSENNDSSLKENKSCQDLFRLWRKAGEVRHWIAVRVGQGHDVESISKKICGKCLVFLDLSVDSKKVASTLLERRASSCVVSHRPLFSQQPINKNRPYSPMNIMEESPSNSQNTVKLAKSLSQKQSLKGNTQQQENVLEMKQMNQIFEFILKESIPSSLLSHTLSIHSHRASLRIWAIDAFASLIKKSSTNAENVLLLRMISRAVRALSKDTGSHHRYHFAANVEYANSEFKDTLRSHYFDLLAMVLRMQKLCHTDPILQMSLLNVDFDMQDIPFLHNSRITQFLLTFIRSDTETSEHSTEPLSLISTAPFIVRYCGWLCFRLVSYLSSRAVQNQSASYGVQEKILSILYHEINSSIAILSTPNRGNTSNKIGAVPVAHPETVSTEWSCKVCTFLNAPSSMECTVCNSSKDSPSAKWTCVSCTFLNQSVMNCCSICRAPKIEHPPTQSNTGHPENTLSAPVNITSWEPSSCFDMVYRKQGSLESLYFFPCTSPEGNSAFVQNVVTSGFTKVTFRIETHTYSRVDIGICSSKDSSLENLNFYSNTGYRTSTNESVSKYGETFGFGDFISVLVSSNFTGSTIEYFKNSVSQGIAFSGVESPFRIFVRCSGHQNGDCISILPKDSDDITQTPIPSSQENQYQPSAYKCPTFWYERELERLGPLGRRSPKDTAMEVSERVYIFNQLLGVLLRCSSSDSFLYHLNCHDWMQMLLRALMLSIDEKFPSFSSFLILRICRFVFAKCSPTDSIFLSGGLAHTFSEWMIQYLGKYGGLDLKWTENDSFTVPESSRRRQVCSEILSLFRILLVSPSWSRCLRGQLEKNLYALKISNLPTEGLTSVFGTLYILGGIIEPLREGAHISFVRNCRPDSGCIVSLEHGEKMNAASLAIRSDTDRNSLILCLSKSDVESLRIQALVEHIIPPGLYIRLFRSLISISEFLLRSNDSITDSDFSCLLLKSSLHFQCCKVLHIAFQSIEFSEFNICLEESVVRTITDIACLRTKLGGISLYQYEEALSSQQNSLCSRISITDANFSKCMEIRNPMLNSSTEAMTSMSTGQVMAGYIYSCGKGDNGRLGHGNNSVISTPSIIRNMTSVLPNEIVKISCFSSHCLCLSTNGSVFSWGKGDDGRLGHGDRISVASPKLIIALESQKGKDIAAGLNFSCVLDSVGNVWTFGSNANGQLASGNFVTCVVPKQVQGLPEVDAMCAGGSHVLAMCGSEIYSWGKNQFGQLGCNSTTKSNMPKRIPPKYFEGSIPRMVSAGWEHSMCVTADGMLFTWGAGYEGNRPVCGHGNNDKVVFPQRVESLSSHFISFCSAGWDHSLAINSEGELFSWGSGNSGMLGHGSTAALPFPTRVLGELSNERIVSCSGGQDHSAAVTDKGHVYIFGAGGHHTGLEVSSQALMPHLVHALADQVFISRAVLGDRCSFFLSSPVPAELSPSNLPVDTVNPLPPYPKHVYSLCGAVEEVTESGHYRDFSSSFHANRVIINDDIFQLTLPLDDCFENGSISFLVSVIEPFDHLSLQISDENSLQSLRLDLNQEMLSCSFHQTNQVDSLLSVSQSIQNFVVTMCNAENDSQTDIRIYSKDETLLKASIPLVNFRNSSVNLTHTKKILESFGIWEMLLSSTDIFHVLSSPLSFVQRDFYSDQRVSSPSILTFSNFTPPANIPFSCQFENSFFCLSEYLLSYTLLLDIECNILGKSVKLFMLNDSPESTVFLNMDGSMHFGTHHLTHSFVSPASHKSFRIGLHVDSLCRKVRLSFNGDWVPVREYKIDEHCPTYTWNDEHFKLGQNMLMWNSKNIVIDRIGLFDHFFEQSCLSDCSVFKEMKRFASFQSYAISLLRMDLKQNWVISALKNQFPSQYVESSDLIFVDYVNRYSLFKWISQHLKFLEEQDVLIEQRKDVLHLQKMGYTLEHCTEAISAVQSGSIADSVGWLLENYPDIANYQETVLMDSDEFEFEQDQKAAAPFQETRNSTKQYSIRQFLLSQVQDHDSDLERLSGSNLLLENNCTSSSQFHCSDSCELTRMNSPQDIIELNYTLSILHSRNCLYNLLHNNGPFNFILLDDTYLLSLIRISIESNFTQLLVLLKQHIADFYANHSDQCQYMVEMLKKECLINMMLLCKDSDQREDLRPNFLISLWILDLFTSLSPCPTRFLFPIQVINMIFEIVLSLDENLKNEHLPFLDILSHLIKNGYKQELLFNHSGKIAKMGRKLMKLHATFSSPNPEGISPMFQSLLEVVISFDCMEPISNCDNSQLYKNWYIHLKSVVLYLRCCKSGSGIPYYVSKQMLDCIRAHQKDIIVVEEIEHMNVFQQFHVNNQMDTELIELISNCNEEITPSSFNPSPNQLATFPSISCVPLQTLRRRLCVLYTIDCILTRSLPLVDLSLASDGNVLVSVFRDFRSLIFWNSKEKLWKNAISSTVGGHNGFKDVSIDRFRAAKFAETDETDEQGNKTIFGQIFHQIYNRPLNAYRIGKNDRLWKVLFKGEHSDDYGGPYRESIDYICAELQSVNLPLFVPSPNNRSNVGMHQDTYLPNTSSTTALHLSMYEFVGRLMGVAIRTRNPLNLNFPPLFWKILVGESISEVDILASDTHAFSILESVDDLMKDLSFSPESLSDIICLSFTVTDSKGDEKELIPGGCDIFVDYHNYAQFRQLFIQYRLEEFSEPIEFIRKGIASVVPYPLISIFNWRELELQVCGSSTIDLDLLQRMTVYDGCTPEDSHVGFFWEMLKTKFTESQRVLFLKFAWGRSRLPLKEKDFENKFKIACISKNRIHNDQSLPVSHTCFFSIELPPYTSLEVMTDRFIYAITHCMSIDADSTTAARSAAAAMDEKEFQNM